MDETGKYFLIIFSVIALIIVIVIANIPTPVPEVSNIQLYADSNMRAKIANEIWWNVRYADVTYMKMLYVFNPYEFNMTLEIYWEAFPKEMTQYCNWTSNSPNIIYPKELIELTLYPTVANNNFLGLSSYKGEVLTLVKGVSKR